MPRVPSRAQGPSPSSSLACTPPSSRPLPFAPHSCSQRRSQAAQGPLGITLPGLSCCPPSRTGPWCPFCTKRQLWILLRFQPPRALMSR